MTNPQPPIQSYTRTAKWLHWVMAFMMITLIAVGLYLSGLDREAPGRNTLIGLHKAFGATFLLMMFVRLSWLYFNRPPQLPNSLQQWEKTLSKVTKTLLYILMFAIPFSGMSLSNVAGYPISFFGLFDFPPFFAKNTDAVSLVKSIHMYLNYSFIVLLVLHIAGAVKHRLFDNDPCADVLVRMGVSNRG